MPALKADFAAPEVQSGRGSTTADRRRFAIRINDDIRIPPDVVDLESFCQWTAADDFPEHGQFSFLASILWVDVSIEELYGHNQVKGEFTRVLGTLARQQKKGRFLPDGMWMKNQAADLSTEPDAMYVSYEAMRSGRVQRVKSPRGILYRLDGAPDMVLGTLSDTSEAKDSEHLFHLYWKAGISEYWLVDVRSDHVRFSIFRHGLKGYIATRKQPGGWLKSAVFEQSFRLTRDKDPLGDPLYTLEGTK